jgi:4-hydroxy-2-oxoheptanedioate aldolase
LIRELEKARAFKEKLVAGEFVLGAQIGFDDTSMVEILARAGFDWLVIDTEHATHDLANVKAMLQAAVHGDAVALVRPLRLDADEIRRYLDMGSPGVLWPFVETGEQAAALVSACRYPPAGIRGYGPRRASVYGFDADEYFVIANDAMICIPIIETVAAIENIDDIVAVDGITGVMIGPMDLSIALGVFTQFESKPYVNAVQRVREACERHGKAMGTGCYSPEHAVACRDLGDQILLAGTDEAMMKQAATAIVANLR